MSTAGDENLEPGPPRPEEHELLIATAREVHGDLVAESVRFWLSRWPRDFYRCAGNQRIRGFTSWLRLDHPHQAELDADPLIADVWRDFLGRAELPEGRHITVARHLVANPSHWAEPSTVTDMYLAGMLGHWLHDAALAASYAAVLYGDYWRPLMEYFDHHQVRDVNPACPYSVFGHDWLADPPPAWRERVLPSELWRPRGTALLTRDNAGESV
ncbi:hypothetical protein ACWEOE_08770 [Amycolatopsis sp. NPDC004368]